MTKRSQIILTATAIIFSVSAFTINITSFGQNRKIAWKNIELVRILAMDFELTTTATFRKRTALETSDHRLPLIPVFMEPSNFSYTKIVLRLLVFLRLSNF